MISTFKKKKELGLYMSSISRSAILLLFNFFVYSSYNLVLFFSPGMLVLCLFYGLLIAPTCDLRSLYYDLCLEVKHFLSCPVVMEASDDGREVEFTH